METINFEDFKKLDIRIAEIVNAEPVSGSSKLLKLSLNLQNETRQVVAGIAESYTPQDLIGKQIPVLCNLAPKIIKGEESRGMILACDDNGIPVLLHPDKKVDNGSTVR